MEEKKGWSGPNESRARNLEPKLHRVVVASFPVFFIFIFVSILQPLAPSCEQHGKLPGRCNLLRFTCTEAISYGIYSCALRKMRAR